MLNILTYNVAQGKYDLSGLNKTITSSGAQIICLQEYNNKVKQHIKLGSNYNLIEPGGKQGFFRNVIYTKLPIIEVNFLPTSGEIRNIIMIKVKFKKCVITILNLHLSAGRDLNKSNQRQTQLNDLFKNITNVKYGIIIGDFNLINDEIPWSNNISPWYKWNVAPLIPTYCSTNLCVKSNLRFRYPFDRCIYQKLTLVNFKLIGNKSKNSDHYGVIYTFTTQNSSSCIIM